MSSRTRICPSQTAEAPMPIVAAVIRGEVAMARATGSTMPSITMAKAPASEIARASSRRRRSPSGRRPCTLNPPIVFTACGVRPIWPITGTPRWTRNATVSAKWAPPSILIAPAPVSFSTRAR